MLAQREHFLAQIGQQQPFTHAQGRLHGVHQSAHERLVKCFWHGQPVNDELNVVLVLFAQAGQLAGQINQLAIDAGADEAILSGLLERVGVGAFAVAGQRGQQLELGACGQGGELLGDLFGRLGGNGRSAIRAVGRTHTGKQHAQIIHHLGDGAHGRARIFAHRFLLNGDGRAQAENGVNFGLFHLPQKLPGVGGQAFHVAPLPFSIDGIKGQG